MFGGIHAATVTPMRADGSLDEKQARSQVEFLRGQGTVVGYLVNGHAGESPYLSLEEQVANLRVYREVHPEATITCGICVEDPRTAIRNVAELARAGAHAVLLFPPWSLAGAGGIPALKAFCRSVCEASPLPVVLYKPAYFSAQAIPVEDMVELAGLPEVAAIKDGSWEVVEFEQVKLGISRAGLDVAVLGSSDEHFFYNYLSGNVGCQASMVTILPEPIARMIALIESGDVAAARKIHQKLAPIARYIYRSGSGADMVARLKLGLAVRGVIDEPHFRVPRVPVKSDEVTTMREMIGSIDF